MNTFTLVWNISFTILSLISAILTYSAGWFKWACVMSFCAGLMLVVTSHSIVDKLLED